MKFSFFIRLLRIFPGCVVEDALRTRIKELAEGRGTAETNRVMSLTDKSRELSLPLRASEIIFDSEVHFVSEVSADSEVMGKLNFNNRKRAGIQDFSFLCVCSFCL